MTAKIYTWGLFGSVRCVEEPALSVMVIHYLSLPRRAVDVFQ